jgi:hypothetical protein
MPQSAERGDRRPDFRHYVRAFDRARQRYQDDPTGHYLAVLLAGEEVLYRELLKSGRFELGQQVMTPGVAEAMRQAGQIPPEFLLRHLHGDWGELDEEDRQMNEHALTWERLEREGRPVEGAIPWWVMSKRLFSRYTTRTHQGLYVITEHDRSATTLLLPEEY